MLTPAQNPRGLAKMMRTQTSFVDIPIVPRLSWPAKQGEENDIATPRGVAMSL
jgi:hypothetical protein